MHDPGDRRPRADAGPRRIGHPAGELVEVSSRKGGRPDNDLVVAVSIARQSRALAARHHETVLHLGVVGDSRLTRCCAQPNGGARSRQVALGQAAPPVGPRRWNALGHNVRRSDDPIPLGCPQRALPRLVQRVPLEQRHSRRGCTRRGGSPDASPPRLVYGGRGTRGRAVRSGRTTERRCDVGDQSR